jgi:hypothetical protein
MEPAIVNQRVTIAVKEHMGDIEHIICPDKLQGNITETHILLIVIFFFCRTERKDLGGDD